MSKGPTCDGMLLKSFQRPLCILYFSLLRYAAFSGRAEFEIAPVFDLFEELVGRLNNVKSMSWTTVPGTEERSDLQF